MGRWVDGCMGRWVDIEGYFLFLHVGLHVFVLFKFWVVG